MELQCAPPQKLSVTVRVGHRLRVGHEVPHVEAEGLRGQHLAGRSKLAPPRVTLSAPGGMNRAPTIIGGQREG